MSAQGTSAKCPCNVCSGHIEFPVDMAGQTVTCPHCRCETLLFVQRLAHPPALSFEDLGLQQRPTVRSAAEFAPEPVKRIGAGTQLDQWAKCPCNHCYGQVEFPKQMAGQTVDCPHCQRQIFLFIPAWIPQPQTQPEGGGVSKPAQGNGTKKCPYCAEEIKAEAVKCKHCGSWMAPHVGAPPPEYGPPPARVLTAMEHTSRSRGIYIILALLFGCAGFHSFYAGYHGSGAGHFALMLFGFVLLAGEELAGVAVAVLLVNAIWALGEAITVAVDAEGYRLT